jgi:diketogulonate reductase-like aldo/keto reductase
LRADDGVATNIISLGRKNKRRKQQVSTIPTITLNNSVEIPQLGFGVLQIPNEETAAAVTNALDAGYRSIDTATIYGNEAGVGKALAESDLNRDELFITTKLWNSEQGYEKTLRAFDESLAKLGLEQLDLYLIHWPTPARDLYLETWRAFEKLYADGQVRAIGVSNFQPEHLRRIMETGGTVPALNQIELHPYLQQAELRGFDKTHQIATEAWSPLAQGGDILGEDVIIKLAQKYNRTPAQVILRWHLQLGSIAIPKSVTPSRIRENLNVFDFSLEESEIFTISTLDKGQRIGFHPDAFNESRL